MVPGGSGNCLLPLGGEKKKDLMSELKIIIDRKERNKHNKVASSMSIGVVL